MTIGESSDLVIQMRYTNDGTEIGVGDQVIVEGDVQGIVVCDFDGWKCLEGYEDWLTKKELVGGGHLTSGVTIKTEKLGVLHYAEPDPQI
jgi:hypothetical protein